MKKTLIISLITFLLVSINVMAEKNNPEKQGLWSARFARMFENGQCIPLIQACDSIITSESALISDKLRALHFKGMAQMALRRYDEFLSTKKNSLTISKPDSLIYWDDNAYIGMNDIYCELNDYSDAEHALAQAEKIMLDPRWKRVDPLVANNERTVLFISKSKLKQSTRNLTGAMSEWMKADTTGNSPSTRLIWLGHGGQLHLQAGDTITAARLFEEGLIMKTENPNKLLVAVNLAMIMNNSGKFKDAFDILGSYRELAETVHDPAVQKDYLFTLSVTLRGLGKENEALAHMQTAMVLADSLAKSDRADLNGILAGKANREQLENVEKDLHKTRSLWTVTIIVAAILLPLLGLWITVLLRHRRKSQNKILNLEENLNNFDAAHSSKLRELEEQVETHSSQLCSAAIRISKIDSGLKEIQKEIDNTDKPSDERVAAIKLNLIEMGREAKSVKRYDILLSRNSRELNEALKLRHPELTKAEVDLCCLIAAGLSNGEIADITQRSIRTVEAIKYTLRKKLGIDESTNAYVLQFAKELRNGHLIESHTNTANNG